MDDAGAVRAVERVADLDRDGERVVDWKPRRPLEPVGKGLALEVLEHQVVELPVAADVVDGADVRIVQRGNRRAPPARSAAAIPNPPPARP